MGRGNRSRHMVKCTRRSWTGRVRQGVQRRLLSNMLGPWWLWLSESWRGKRALCCCLSAPRTRATFVLAAGRHNGPLAVYTVGGAVPKWVSLQLVTCKSPMCTRTCRTLSLQCYRACVAAGGCLQHASREKLRDSTWAVQCHYSQVHAQAFSAARY